MGLRYQREVGNQDDPPQRGNLYTATSKLTTRTEHRISPLKKNGLR